MNRSARLCLAGSLLAGLAACGKVTSPDDDDADNQPPVATPAELSTWMSTPIEGRLAGEDPDGNLLTFAVADEPTGGQLELDEDGSFRYTPDRGTSGDDAFTFVVDDSRDTSAEATVDISIATLTDGTPDATFGDGGAVISDFGEVDAFSGVAAQQDGRIVGVGNTASALAVVAGYSNRGGLLNPWGEGGSGSTMLNVGTGYDAFGDVVQQDGGRLVSVGQTQDGDRDFILLGLTAGDGYLDSSFGGGGVTVTDIAVGQADVANAVALLPDGRLLVAGYANNGTDDDMAVARYSKNGVLDEDFGSGGFTVIDFGGAERVNNLAVDGEGNIVLVGEADDDMGIARLTAEGEPDTGFGDGGKVHLDRAGSYDDAVGVAFGSNGAIYVGGSSEVGESRFSMAAVVLTADGELDTGFGEDGWALATPTGASTYASDMLLLPNQTLLLVGSWGEGATTEAAAARLDLSGQLDPAFGADGIYHQAFGSGSQDALFAAALQDDGKVVAAGWSRNADLDGLLVRLAW